MSGFIIKNEVFEGPLDLLLSLIEKRKLLINEISLAKITDEFISHVKEIENYKLADRANFIVISSTLILIKSRSLLPQLSLTSEEEDSIGDLERRLKIYQRIKELSSHVRERFGSNLIYFANENKNAVKVFAPDKNTNVKDLLVALGEVIKKLPKQVLTPKAIVKQVISLEDMMDKLQVRINSALKLSFKDFSGAKKIVTPEEKINIIVSFLAMLELVKQGMLEVRQIASFEDIEIQKMILVSPRTTDLLFGKFRKLK